jgi:hypothetical protein
MEAFRCGYPVVMEFTNAEGGDNGKYLQALEMTF